MDDSCCPLDTNMQIDDEINRLPLYMDYSSELMYQNTITERSQFANFVDTKLAFLNNSVFNLLKEINNTDNTVGWLGGSRAWKRLYDTYNITSDMNNPSSGLMKSSIGVAGNYDIFVLYNDASNFDNLFKAITGKVRELFNQIVSTASINNLYEVTLSFPKGQTMKGEMCALFPCVSIAIELTSRPTGRRGETTNTNSFPTLQKKLLLYVEVGLYSRINVNLIRDKLMDSTYALNALGLFTFSQFIVSPRREKDINVDMYRDLFIQELMESSNVTLSRTLFETANVYRNIFQEYMNGPSLSRHDVFVNELYINAAFTWYEKQNKYKINDYYTYVVAEALRPVIQSGIIMISKLLKHHYDLFNAHIFIVGGDAMRRYISTAVQTNDFDTKILYSKNDTKLLPLMINCLLLIITMLEFAYYLDYNDYYTFTNKGDGNTSFKIFIPKLKKAPSGVSRTQSNDLSLESMFERMDVSSFQSPTSLTTNTSQESLNNSKYYLFRPRIIEKSEYLPVDLLSIDMNIPIVVQIDGVGDIDSRLSIPILDIVLQQVNDPNPVFNVKDYETTLLPIASKEFLIKDLENTYTNLSLAKMRYFNNKKDKDVVRLKSLRESGSYDPRLDSVLLTDKSIIASYSGEIHANIKLTAEMYRTKLKTVMCSNKRKGYVKHKLAFSKAIVESINVNPKRCASFNWDEMIYNVINIGDIVYQSGGGSGKNKKNTKKQLTKKEIAEKIKKKFGGRKINSLQKDYHQMLLIRKGKLN